LPINLEIDAGATALTATNNPKNLNRFRKMFEGSGNRSMKEKPGHNFHLVRRDWPIFVQGSDLLVVHAANVLPLSRERRISFSRFNLPVGAARRLQRLLAGTRDCRSLRGLDPSPELQARQAV
jgi:hypothetical protein